MAYKMVARTGFTAANDATDLNEVGSLMLDGSNGKEYRYVRAEDAALAANNVVLYADATGGEVTKDVSGGSALGTDQVAGVAVATITDAYYGWIQTRGVATCAVAANTAVAAGDLVIMGGSDGVCAAATTSTTYKAFGMALAADTATTSDAGTVSVMLHL